LALVQTIVTELVIKNHDSIQGLHYFIRENIQLLS
jgi:hypothetical protein